VTAADPRMLAVFDATSGQVATIALADVAADIRRYEVLGSADSSGISPA
jgi:hypothetical protein